jgi:hypothetical protein
MFDADLRRRIANILPTCFTLKHADYCLTGLFADRFTKFALWDGWAGRPHSLAGIVPKEIDATSVDWERYREIYGVGRELRRRHDKKKEVA